MFTLRLTLFLGCKVEIVAPKPCATGCPAISNPWEESKLFELK
jgi:hypothetical protein